MIVKAGGGLRHEQVLLELRFQCAGSKVQGSEFRIQGSGFRMQGSGLRVQGSGFRVQGSRFRVQGSGFQVSSFTAQGLGVCMCKPLRPEQCVVLHTTSPVGRFM